MDVTFFEKTPFFHNHLQGGETVQYFQIQNSDFSVLDSMHEEGSSKAQNKGKPSQQNKISNKDSIPETVLISEPVLEA